MTDGSLLGPNAKRDLNTLRNRYIRRQPDAGQASHRRNPWGSDSGSDGNGNSSGPCGCCNCLDCIDLCDARDEDVVTDCEACGVAIKTYLIDVGNWSAFPELGGSFLVTHVDGGCVWESDNLTQSSGVYKWVLTLAGGSSTLQLEHVSGADPVHLLNGWRQVKYVADGSWNCLCASHMKAESRERITRPAGLNCSICVIPRLGVYNPTCPTIPSVDGVIPCFTRFTFPDITFLFSEDNPNHCKYVSCENIPGNPMFNFPYGFEGSTERFMTLHRSGLDEHCPWGGGISEADPVPPVVSNGISIGGHDGLSFSVSVDYTAGTIDLLFYSYQGQVQAQYYLDPTDWVIGLNTLDLINDYGSSTAVTWPATITITATDCMYSSTHPDYGYGCGYGVTGDEPADCGDSCYWLGIAVEGGDPIWSQTGGTGIDFCANCGGCPEPAVAATVGATAQTFCNGV